MDLLKGSYQKIIDVLTRAELRIIIAMPNLSIELARLLEELHNRIKSISVFMDIREEIYREGYGEIEALEILSKAKVRTFNICDFNISFIITDEIGYFYFPKSRFFEEEGSSFDLIPMSELQSKLFIQVFSDPGLFMTIPYPAITESEQMDTKTISSIVSPLNDDFRKTLEEKIKNDPPLRPELNRTLKTYISKFQIIELKFTGANIHIKKVKLPRKALPFKDAALNRAIEASLRLFTDIPEKKFLESFFQIKNEIDHIRFDFLTHIKTRDKNLINRKDKGEFSRKINICEGKLQEVLSGIINELQGEIGKTRETIFKNLFDFLILNIPEDFKEYSGSTLQKELDYYARKIVGSIHFPTAKELVNDVKIECHYYNLTWEDLNNEKVIDEMIKYNLITREDGAYILETAIKASKEN